jgi:hypothetical protein
MRLTRGTAMYEPSFVDYIGDRDFHDGAVTAVEQEHTTVRVGIRGASGRSFVVEFGGVRALRANCPVGMLLYALIERSSTPPLRRFSFAKWDDDNDAFLEVDAETVDVREE